MNSIGLKGTSCNNPEGVQTESSLSPKFDIKVMSCTEGRENIYFDKGVICIRKTSFSCRNGHDYKLIVLGVIKIAIPRNLNSESSAVYISTISGK